MDCCDTNEEKKHSKNLHRDSHKSMKGGKNKMERKVLLWGSIGILFVLALFLVFQAGSAGSVDVQTAQDTVRSAASASSYGGMVGGC